MKLVKKMNANHLKFIAIIAMTIDHFTDLVYPGFPAEPVAIILHIIGRLTAPIMWFFVCEGFHYTRNIKRYMSRLLVFALISHFAYCFAFGIDPVPLRSGIFNQTSVMYPLFIAVVVLWLQNYKPEMNKYLKHATIFILIWCAFPADWSCIAVLSILWMYKYRGDLKTQMKGMLLYVALYGLVSFFFVSKVYALVTPGVLLIYPLLKRYNGEKGKMSWMKWFFYIYYPAHLIIVGILRLTIYGNVSLLF